MCTECHQHPCHPQCPNAEGPVVLHECAWCDAEIYDGDEYYDIGGEIVCTECVNECKHTAEA